MKNKMTSAKAVTAKETVVEYYQRVYGLPENMAQAMAAYYRITHQEKRAAAKAEKENRKAIKEETMAWIKSHTGSVNVGMAA